MEGGTYEKEDLPEALGTAVALEESNSINSHNNNNDNSTIGTNNPQQLLLVVPAVPIEDVIAVQVDTIETVEMVAPCDLPGGYHLHVDTADSDAATLLGNNNNNNLPASVLVEVPQGGVTQGQRFQAIVIVEQPPPPSSSSTQKHGDHHNVPMGAWRDGLLDCFKLGWCHTVLCLTCWAAPLTLGQVLMRLNLNACAEPPKQDNKETTATTTTTCCTPVWTMRIFYAFIILTSVVLGQIVNSLCEYDSLDGDDQDDENGKGREEPLWLLGVRFSRVGLSFFFNVFFIIVATRTRYFIRQKYKIPATQCCGGCGECEDVCLAVFCYPCSICQMARHTADYENGPQQASCCSETGLKDDKETSNV